jgi:hypothetical protein
MRRGNSLPLVVQKFFQELYIFVINVADAIFFKTAKLFRAFFLLNGGKVFYFIWTCHN